MEIVGTVEKVIRRRTDYGSTYLTVDIDRYGHVARMRYLHGFEPVPKRGDKITLEGMPLVGFKRSNVGAVRVTIHGA